MPTTKEQLEALSPEERNRIIARAQEELARRKSGQSKEPSPFLQASKRILPAIGRGTQAGLEVLPSILLEGKTPTSGTAGLEEFLLREKVKEEIRRGSPSERRAQLDIEERERKEDIRRKNIEAQNRILPPPLESITAPINGDMPIQGGVPSVPRVDREVTTGTDIARGIGSNLSEIPPKLEIRTGQIDPETGLEIIDEVDNPEFTFAEKAGEVALTELQKSISKLQVGGRISFNNLEKVGGSLSDVDRLFAEGHELGTIGAGTFSRAALEIAKFRGGEAQDALEAANAFEGKVAEALFNMIPMLTQQGEKAGSVRIMRSVLKLLGKTLPNIGTGLKAGHRQLEESIRSFYRFARAAELSGLSFAKQFKGRSLDSLGESDLKSWVAKVEEARDRVRIKPGSPEEEALESFIDEALKASGELIAKRELEKRGQRGLSPQDQAELNQINQLLGVQ